jgi:hypothetical protein
VSTKKNETDLLREANTTREQLAEEFRGVEASHSLPIVENGKQLDRGAAVYSPSAAELKMFGNQRAQVCGNCKHFDLEKGRQEMIRQRFPERLVREQSWQLRHLGGKIDEVGLCGQSGGTMATTFMSKACDQYREKKQ